MKTFLLSVLLVGCANGITTVEPEPVDAGELCCAVNHSYSDGGILTNAVYQCGDIGQSISMIPWLCLGDDGAALACNAPGCSPNDRCQGFNGTGTVVPCSEFEGAQ
jgi:hypothetical protein